MLAPSRVGKRWLLALLTAIVVGCAFYSLYFTLAAYHMHIAEDGRLQSLQIYQKRVEQRVRAYDRYQQLSRAAQAVIAKAAQVGANPGSWDRYQVNIDRPVSFAELAELVAQAEHGAAYYFKAQRLEVIVAATNGADQKQTAKESSSIEPDNEGAEALLLIQGAYLVRGR